MPTASSGHTARRRRSLLLDFSIKMSTALSQAVIAAGAVGSVAYAATRGHPRDKHRWLIDYDLALTLTPVLLLGVMGGAPGGGPLDHIAACPATDAPSPLASL